MKWVRIVVIVVVVAVLGLGIYDLMREKGTLKKDVNELRDEFENLQEENRELVSQIEYFENPKNLLKEIKSHFNYREQGEGLIIIVPNATSTD